MHAQRILVLVLLLTALLLTAAAVSAAADTAAAAAPLDLSWTVIGAGGGHAASTSYSLDATLGQPFVGMSSNGGVTLSAGFWQYVDYRIYLPLLRK